MFTKEEAMIERRRIKRFTKEQMEKLASNAFTHRITRQRISFTLEFKNLFLAEYERGENVKDIFTRMGYDTEMLGRSRIYGFATRITEQAEAGEIPTEEPIRTKVEKPVKIDYNTMPAQQSVSAMQREITYLRQQIEFLKKITEMDNNKKSRK